MGSKSIAPDSNTPPAPPAHWGASSAAFYAQLEDEVVTVYFTAAEHQPLVGQLVGVDRYDIFLEVAGQTVLVCKHGVRYLTPGNVSAETSAERRGS